MKDAHTSSFPQVSALIALMTSSSALKRTKKILVQPQEISLVRDEGFGGGVAGPGRGLDRPGSGGFIQSLGGYVYFTRHDTRKISFLNCPRAKART